jgi:hypothetical protein
MKPRLQVAKLLHQLTLDVEAAGGVEDDYIAVEPARLGNTLLTLDEGNFLAVGKRAELLDGSGSAKVERHDEWTVALTPSQ